MLWSTLLIWIFTCITFKSGKILSEQGHCNLLFLAEFIVIDSQKSLHSHNPINVIYNNDCTGFLDFNFNYIVWHWIPCGLLLGKGRCSILIPDIISKPILNHNDAICTPYHNLTDPLPTICRPWRVLGRAGTGRFILGSRFGGGWCSHLYCPFLSRWNPRSRWPFWIWIPNILHAIWLTQ